ncbi:MAG: DUF4291 domain-containing protein [Cyanobacteria bacterium P01_G01_bin.54]
MQLITTSYLAQVTRLPQTGRHIVAQYDANSIVVYQAYRPAIANFAVQQGYFGGEFRLNRMSWIKPNFLWMMYRAGWATKPGQEHILAIRIQRAAFDTILAAAVHAKYIPELYGSPAAWKQTLSRSLVRLQWDPDRHPLYNRLERRAIQLGLRGEILAKYAQKWIVSIEDISEFVHQQYQWVQARDWQNLIVPQETVYPVQDRAIAQHLQLSAVDTPT